MDSKRMINAGLEPATLSVHRRMLRTRDLGICKNLPKAIGAESFTYNQLHQSTLDHTGFCIDVVILASKVYKINDSLAPRIADITLQMFITPNRGSVAIFGSRFLRSAVKRLSPQHPHFFFRLRVSNVTHHVTVAFGAVFLDHPQSPK